jgi:hypothetical protein
VGRRLGRLRRARSGRVHARSLARCGWAVE